MQVGIDKRWFLIGLISLTQLVCILGVGSIALRGIESRIQDHAYERAFDENAKVLLSVSKQIRRQGLRNFEPESADWNALQNVVAAIRLPNDGLVSVIRATDGQLVCHPAFRSSYQKLPETCGGTIIRSDDGTCHILDLAYDSCGSAEIDDRKVLLAVHAWKTWAC